MSLSRTTLEVALRAVTLEVKSFVEGGTFEEDWRDFAEAATAGAELHEELGHLKAAATRDDELAAEHERLCERARELDKTR